jgi:hypothetical protein
MFSITYSILLVYLVFISTASLYFWYNRVRLPKIDLYEISMVTFPMNEHVFTFEEAMIIKELIGNQVVGYRNGCGTLKVSSELDCLDG